MMCLDQTLISSIKSIILKGWRERWSDVQWGIQIKSVLPDDATSEDSYKLAEILLNQALSGPCPNALILSYLQHSLASQLVSHANVLQAVAQFNGFGKPYCSQALLEVISSSLESLISRGTPDDCLQLAVSVLHAMIWMAKLLFFTFGKLVTDQDSKPDVSNCNSSLELMLRFLKNDFSSGLLYVSKGEDREKFHFLVSTIKIIVEDGKSGVLYEKDPSLKRKLNKIATSLRNIDPIKSTNKSNEKVFGLVRSIQPLLAFEALFRPTSDLKALSHELYSIALTQNVKFSDMVYKILQSCLLSISEDQSINSLKWDAFILIRLSPVLHRLSILMQIDRSELKTPTDLYKSFDQILKHDALLNLIDIRHRCNIVAILVEMVRKMPTPLMTETEILDVEKRRETNLLSLQTDVEMISEDLLGDSRSIEMILKAETKIDSNLKILDTDTMEARLKKLCEISKGENLDFLLAAASANGKLKPFIRTLVKLNQHSQESQGESVKNSLLRAAIFDITFLLLVHVVQRFGSKIMLEEATGTLVHTWVSDMMVEKNNPKPINMSMVTENAMVDNLLQQLNNGELRTQVVKWQNVCLNIHLAVKEMITARGLNALDKKSYIKMLRIACSKLCSIPICVYSWMINFKSSFASPDQWNVDLDEICDEMFDLAKDTTLYNTDMPHVKERLALMYTIFQKMQEDSGNAYAPFEEKENKVVKHKLSKTWHNALTSGIVDIESAVIFKDLFELDHDWFVTCLMDELLSISHQDELENATDLLSALFHIDVESCCLSLLRCVIPFYIKNPNQAALMTNPHGTAIAKILTRCLYANLVAMQSEGEKLSGLKRSYGQKEDEDMDKNFEKFRKLVTGHQGVEVKKDTLEESELEKALVNFFHILQEFCENESFNPVSHFAISFLDESSSNGRKSRLVAQHLSLPLVIHLVRTVPTLFTMSFIARVLDSGTISGRRNMAKVMCLLKAMINRKGIALLSIRDRI